MTKELIELESNYFVLSHLLIQRIAKVWSEELEETKTFLKCLEKFSIQEKTLYVAELLEATENKEQEKLLNNFESILKNEEISDNTISILKQYSRWF